MSHTLLTYLSVTFFLVVTPGITTTIVIQRTLRSGVRAGVAAAAGAAAGNSTHALLAGLGLSVVLRRSPRLLAALGIAGGLYLCWLGLSTLVRAYRGRPPLASEPGATRGSAVREGWTGTVLNPSIVTFYLTVLPSFIPPDGSIAAFALLAAIHVSMAFACHLCWAVALDRLRALLAHPLALRALDAAAGVALMLLGIKLLAT